MKRIFLIAPVVFLCLCLCGVGWGEERFVVAGTSERGEDVPHPTLELALKDGLMKAVEEAVRGMMAFQAMEEQYEALTKGVYDRAESFVLSYKILEKHPLPTGYQVLLEVLVDTEGVKKRLESLGLLKGSGKMPHLREVELVVAGIKNYQVYLTVEGLLREDTTVQTSALSEIEPTKFTWRLSLRGETGTLAERFLRQGFSGLKAKVVTLTPEKVEIQLSN